MKINTLFALLIISLNAIAEFNDEHLCEQLDQFKIEHAQEFNDIKDVKKELLWSQIFPRRYFNLKIDSKKYKGKYTTEKRIKKGLILSIGSPKLQPGSKEKFSRLLKSYQDENKKFLKLLKRKNIQSCKDLKQKLSFNYNKFEAAKENLKSFKEFSKWQEYQAVNNATKNILKSKKISWNIKYNITKRDIKKALLNKQLSHIIFIMHAKDNGFLVDSNSIILPTSLFENAHPSIESMLVMSCYSDLVIKKYNLRTGFVEASGNYQTKTLVTPSSKLTIQDNRSILKILKFYLKQYQSKVTSKINLSKNIKEDIKMCQYTLSSELKGGIDLFVNDKVYLGEFTDNQKTFKTNCLNLKGAKYISVRPHTHSAPKFKELSISGLSLKKHFYFKETYSGSSFNID